MMKKYNNHYNNYAFNNSDKVCLPGIPVVSLTMTLPVSMMPGGSAAVPNFKFFCRWKKNSGSDPLCLGPRYNTFLKSPVCEGQNAAGPIRVGRTVQEKRQSKRKHVFGVIRAYSPVLHEIFCMPKLPLCPNYPRSLYNLNVKYWIGSVLADICDKKSEYRFLAISVHH